MTRHESLAALAAAFLLFAGGLVWLFGALGLIGSALLLAASTVFFVRVEGRPSGESVGDAVPDPFVAALERDFSL